MRLMTSLLTLSLSAGAAGAQVTLDFESLAPRNPALGGNYWPANPGFSAGDVAFSGGSYSGFVVSDSRVITGPGYLFEGSTAEISAYAPASTTPNRFAIAYDNGVIRLPEGKSPLSVDLTNTATAYFAVRDGYYFASAFGGADGTDPDFFSVTFSGLDAQGAPVGSPVVFFLADFRGDSASDYIVSDWTRVDLTPLGAARSIAVSLDSSDTSTFGGVTYLNTPAYVALDNLTVVPEPGIAVVVLAMLPILRRR